MLDHLQERIFLTVGMLTVGVGGFCAALYGFLDFGATGNLWSLMIGMIGIGGIMVLNIK